MENIYVHSSETDKNKYKELKQDLETKEKQLKKYKYLSGPLAFFYKNKIKKLKEKLNELIVLNKNSISNGHRKLAEPKESMESFDLFNMGTDENLELIFVDNLNKHLAIFGGSGSGKSVAIFGILRQAMEKGGGCAVVDGKGDLEMWKDFVKHAIDTNRVEDIRVLNYNPGFDSNSFNIFETMEITDIKSIVSSLTVGKAKDFFGKQSESVLDAIFYILAYLKETGVRITFDTFQEITSLEALIVNLIEADSIDKTRPNQELIRLNSLQKFEKYWIPKDYIYQGTIAYPKIISPVNSYGCEINRNEDDAEENGYKPVPSDQLIQQIGGYAGMTLKGIQPLVNKFGNIFNSPKNDINFEEAISQNQLIYVILPSMNLSQDDPHSIGAFIMESFKNAVGKSLGNKVETNTDDPLLMFSKLQLRSSPLFPLVLDELAAFVEKSKDPLGTLLAQARSVNISIILASQDVASLAAGEGGMNFVDKMLGNTSTQLFLKTQDKSTADKSAAIILSKGKVLDENGEEIKNEDFQKDIREYLLKAADGIGIIKNIRFGKSLSPFIPPKSNFQFKIKV